MGLVSVMKMRCPYCASKLEGRSNDKVFPCLACGRYYEVGEGAFVERELVVIQGSGELKGDYTFYAPTWEFDVEAKVDAMPEEIDDAIKIAAGYTKIYVSAFRMWRPGYFGVPGRLYTLAQIKRVPFEGKLENPLIVGCVRSGKEALEFVKPTLLAAIDSKLDVSAIDVTGAIKGARLLAIPYVAMGEKVFDTQLKWEYPIAMFEDLAELVRDSK